MELYEIRDILGVRLKLSRYEHTLGVAETAALLGRMYAADPYRCELAGILHDCAKCYTGEEIIRLCEENRISLTKDEITSPQLIHAKYGAFVARSEFGIDDREVLNAIRWHTTGRPGMTLLEQIVFVSDYIEPHRDKEENLNFLRKTAFTDIDKCTALILSDTIKYLRSIGSEIGSDSISTYEYYRKFL